MASLNLQPDFLFAAESPGPARSEMQFLQSFQAAFMAANVGGGNISHAALGKLMIAYDYVCKIEGVLAIWEGDHYELGRDAVCRRMLGRCEGITSNKRAETLSYLEYLAPEYDMAPSNLIAFTNGVLDIEAMTLMTPSPDIRIPNVIPHRWNPEAKSDVLENALNAWACSDESVRLNIEETIGLCMCRTRSLRDSPILCGEGRNGKSTFLNFLINLIGEDNVSTLDLATVGERFQSVALIGKLVNVGDDIANDFVRGGKLAIVKKVISGDWIPAEYKGGATFKFRPYCMMVFSCNEFPRMGDHSTGIFSRLLPIPFDADFSAQSGRCNTALGRDLMGEDICEAAIVLGVKALVGCLQRGGMTRGARQMKALEQVKRDNSSVYQFACERLNYGEADPVDIMYSSTSSLYNFYVGYCDESGLKAVARNSFSTEMCKLYKAYTQRETIGGVQERCFVPAFT